MKVYVHTNNTTSWKEVTAGYQKISAGVSYSLKSHSIRKQDYDHLVLSAMCMEGGSEFAVNDPSLH